MSGEMVFLVGCVLVPAVGSFMLPRIVRLIAGALGAVAAYLFLLVIPNGGADSPANIIVAITAAGVAIGAVLREVWTFVSTPRRQEAIDG